MKLNKEREYRRPRRFYRLVPMLDRSILLAGSTEIVGNDGVASLICSVK